MLEIDIVDALKKTIVKGDNFEFEINDLYRYHFFNNQSGCVIQFNLMNFLATNEKNIKDFVDKFGIEKIEALINGNILNDIKHKIECIDSLKIEYNGQTYCINIKGMIIYSGKIV